MSTEKNKYLIYIRWFISDQKERLPRTKADFLTEYELEEEDLIEFENRPTFYDDIEREIKNWGISKLPEVLRNSYEAAKKPGASSGAIRAFKELLEDSKNKNNTVNIFAINPTDDQYAKMLARENKRLLGGDRVIDITP